MKTFIQRCNSCYRSVVAIKIKHGVIKKKPMQIFIIGLLCELIHREDRMGEEGETSPWSFLLTKENKHETL